MATELRIVLERIEDGRVMQRHEETMVHDDDEELGMTLGCITGLAVNAFCNADEPYVMDAVSSFLNRANHDCSTMYAVADLNRLWNGKNDLDSVSCLVMLKGAMREEVNQEYTLIVPVDKLPTRADTTNH